MSDTQPDDGHPGSPLQWTRRTLRGVWRDFKSVYYANTPIWRGLKSAALVFLGLFCWAGANLLLSYLPDQGWLYVVLSYGFLLLFWGPLTHLLVVPLIIRWRRTAQHPATRWFSRHGTTVNLTVFFVLVLVLAAFPLGIMTFQFQLPSGGGDGAVDPRLQCTRSGDSVHCHISDSRGIDHVHVLSGGELIAEDTDPPFDFDVAVEDLQAVRGDKQFTVELRDENDQLLRRYQRPIDLIPG
jgi:hypothetical protein